MWHEDGFRCRGVPKQVCHQWQGALPFGLRGRVLPRGPQPSPSAQCTRVSLLRVVCKACLGTNIHVCVYVVVLSVQEELLRKC